MTLMTSDHSAAAGAPTLPVRMKRSLSGMPVRRHRAAQQLASFSPNAAL
jgi:hypothetical protein